MVPMSDVVIGANGMVGRALMSYLSDATGTRRDRKENEIEGRHYRYLDITDKKAVSDLFFEEKPKKVFIAAANPNVDLCENTETDKVNIFGISDIIVNCRIHKAQAIFFSSSYVFDGKSQTPYRPKDETGPINRYGRQKEQIEKLMMGMEDLNWLIIRTVGVFGIDNNPRNFVYQVFRAIKDGRKIYAPTDQTMNPINSMDLAKVAIHLSNRYSGEIFHVAGNKNMTKYDFAISVAYKMGCKKPHDLIVGVRSENMKQIAIRPSNGCLDCGSLGTRAITIPNFEKGLTRYVNELQ